MAELQTETDSTVVTTEVLKTDDVKVPVLRLRLTSPKNDKKIKWKEGTVDNEGMGKKSSKCCCIYKKPKLFGESSDSESSDDDLCKAPKTYHKRSKKNHDNHENCSACT
ncbi:E3 ubiquitin-protein ligase PPP1R11 isoform X2 [Hydra vulgaris]|uniref:E3 ubiquitin-protein ligase PPP1R11 n=1 Tax=Hydra vulgaris TaxID=6087 RepID=A0ABM4B3N6_HYDVU